ncbi:unnamed protein product [Linum tenue]|uniref:Uncharacterized protein n=1 Tax=Linum tenue TaxID=586396 RepID=A0AAV0GVV3_9ROSI|nr:unnamed protein product [Linum tenue]
MRLFSVLQISIRRGQIPSETAQRKFGIPARPASQSGSSIAKKLTDKCSMLPYVFITILRRHGREKAQDDFYQFVWIGRHGWVARIPCLVVRNESAVEARTGDHGAPPLADEFAPAAGSWVGEANQDLF